MVEQKQNRIAWIDTAKGYGMILVILAHISTGHPVAHWIYTFHMPLFFFLSGCVFRAKDSFRVFLGKRIRSIVVPYFCLGGVVCIFEILTSAMKGSIITGSNVTQLLLSFLLQRRLWALWFIACLFWMNLLFFGIVRCLKTPWRIGGGVLLFSAIGYGYVLLGGPTLFWNMDAALTGLPFFYAGYLFRRVEPQVRSFAAKPVSILCFLILGAVNVVTGFVNRRVAGQGLDFFYNAYGFLPLTYLSAFAGIACFVMVSNWLPLRTVRFIGCNSMIYYAWHQNIMIPIIRGLFAWLQYPSGFFAKLPEMLAVRLPELALQLLILTGCCLLLTKAGLGFAFGHWKKE